MTAINKALVCAVPRAFVFRRCVGEEGKVANGKLIGQCQ